ncbi:aldo/keto reductase [Paenibacillus agricola]|uniref:Aldo/keto reductase n=1 Tax=Paenibacillus agricola TaxID=2716264 RepID=A0ABX0J6J4_9BACL|nr:aldo/keto reductase [Paenibacillus agricola]NHN30448.1 aldo/keto reductase [Paenibacillus agricola]
MKKRRLGNSDLEVSILGVGCFQFGGGSYWGPQDLKDVEDVVHRALDTGINYFDTAEVYNEGESERALGLALKGRRDQAIIGSKVTTANIEPAKLRAHCEDSLRRLGTDYMDLYMLHWPLNPLSVKHYSSDEQLMANLPSVQEVFNTLHDLKKEGKIRHIGISNHGVQQMGEVLATQVPVVANELAYNLLSRAIESELVPYCAEKQIGVIAYMPLQQGLLTGKYSTLDEVRPMLARTRHFHHSRTDSRHGEEGAELETGEAIRAIIAIAAELQVSPSVLSLAWVMANEHMATTIVGSRNLAHLHANVQGASLQLDHNTMTRLNDATEQLRLVLGNNPDYWENRNDSRIF